MPLKRNSERVFEIGCGSGNLSHLLLKNFQIQHYLLNDLYAEVQEHFQGYSNIDWLLGDIEQLNFPSDLELIVSTSALQWMTNLDAVFQKANDSLLPHGLFCFSTFGERNLQEIKTLTGQGLDYVNLDQLREKLQNQGFEVLHLSEHIGVLDFANTERGTATLKSHRCHGNCIELSLDQSTRSNAFIKIINNFHNSIHQGQIHYRRTYHPIYCIARRMP